MGRLLAGNVGGAMLVGDTVRRPTGLWTPAVHALLAYLEPRLPNIPKVLGRDEKGREVLTYLPGRVIDINRERLNERPIAVAAGWTRAFHAARDRLQSSRPMAVLSAPVADDHRPQRRRRPASPARASLKAPATSASSSGRTRGRISQRFSRVSPYVGRHDG